MLSRGGTSPTNHIVELTRQDHPELFALADYRIVLRKKIAEASPRESGAASVYEYVAPSEGGAGDG